jgi:hypothetical protein
MSKPPWRFKATRQISSVESIRNTWFLEMNYLDSKGVPAGPQCILSQVRAWLKRPPDIAKTIWTSPNRILHKTSSEVDL